MNAIHHNLLLHSLLPLLYRKRADFAIRLRWGSLVALPVNRCQVLRFLFCTTYGKNRAEAAGDAHKNNVAKCNL